MGYYSATPTWSSWQETKGSPRFAFFDVLGAFAPHLRYPDPQNPETSITMSNNTMSNDTTIPTTRAFLLRLTAAYNSNLEASTFQVDGKGFVPSYARYLIEYLAGQLGVRFQIDASGLIKPGRM